MLRSRGSPSVDVDDQLTVRGACGVEFLLAVVELASKLGDQLFELRDAVLELVDVDGGAKAGLAPRLLAEMFGESFLQLTDAALLARDLAVSVGEIGL